MNLSSNNIRYISNYFASNLSSIRIIDFDLNENLNLISPKPFCSINILTLEKLSFRSNDIYSLDIFSELLCRLIEKNHQKPILDLNNNINLGCNCMLIRFEKYLLNYHELLCTQQGQDRYYISNIKNRFSNCTKNICLEEKSKSLCQRSYTEPLITQRTCQKKLIKNESSIKNQSRINLTTINYQFWQNLTENSTLFKSFAVSLNRLDYLCFFIIYFTFQNL